MTVTMTATMTATVVVLRVVVRRARRVTRGDVDIAGTPGATPHARNGRAAAAAAPPPRRAHATSRRTRHPRHA